MVAERLIDASGNKYDPNSMVEWQDEALAFYQGAKAIYPYAVEAASLVTDVYRDFARQSNRYFNGQGQSVASGYGGDPIKGPMGNSTVVDPTKPMAYGRNRTRTASRGRSYTSKRKSSGISKGLAAAVRKIAKRAIGSDAEKKFFGVELGAATPAANVAAITHLTPVPQGTTAQSDTVRVGDQIHARTLMVRAQIRSTGAPADVMRVVVFKWKPETTPSAASSIIDSSFGVVVNAPYAQDIFRNHQTIILADQTFITSAVDNDMTPVVWKFALDHKINFVAGGTTACGGGIYLWYASVAGTSSITMTSNLQYTDA